MRRCPQCLSCRNHRILFCRCYHGRRCRCQGRPLYPDVLACLIRCIRDAVVLLLVGYSIALIVGLLYVARQHLGDLDIPQVLRDDWIVDLPQYVEMLFTSAVGRARLYRRCRLRAVCSILKLVVRTEEVCMSIKLCLDARLEIYARLVFACYDVLVLMIYGVLCCINPG